MRTSSVTRLVRHRVVRLALAIGLSGLLLALWLVAMVPAHADPAVRYVAPDGDDSKLCDSIADRCRTVQRAIDVADPFDEIRVATGTYTDVAGTVAVINKTVTLLGGWDGAFNEATRDPGANPTILDALQTGAVISITGYVSPTVDGFTITGGKAPDGGGVHIYDASPIIQNNVITANLTITSGIYADGRGGGIYVGGTSYAIIAENLILSNTSGYGGGIYHDGSTAITIIANEIAGNVASYRGGGILVENSPDIVQANVISGNTAAGDGGGMLIWHAALQVEANRITGNSANSGGGISMGNNATPSLLNNLVISNARDGLLIGSSSPVVVNNTIVGSGLTASRYMASISGAALVAPRPTVQQGALPTISSSAMRSASLVLALLLLLLTTTTCGATQWRIILCRPAW